MMLVSNGNVLDGMLYYSSNNTCDDYDIIKYIEELDMDRKRIDRNIYFNMIVLEDYVSEYCNNCNKEDICKGSRRLEKWLI